ncbi:MAG TPA: AbrB family transcriptional regulator [Burkholderiaceae bacterium]|nr:AbrB family transcriptional regulator [Burkholderiaceae bacterium]
MSGPPPGTLNVGHRLPLAPIARLTRTPRFAVALSIALSGGALFAWLHSPLPWLIGPLIACGLANIFGAKLQSPLLSRNVGQWVIGTALGLYFTAETLQRLATLLWPLVGGLVFAYLLGGAYGWALRRFVGMDPATAFFAGAVGGASEMAIQGERNGASVETIAAAHTLRVMIVVIFIPFLYQWLGLHGSDGYVPGRVQVVPQGLALLVAATCAAALAMRRIRSPNAWLIGPLLATAAMTATGVVPSALPGWVISAGQVLIGMSLGVRFAPGFFSRAPRLCVVVTLFTFVAIGLSAAFGSALGWLADIPAATMILATAPGGVAEMSLTAKILQLGVPVVSTFQLLRLLAMVLTAGSIYRLLARRFGWPMGDLPVHPREDEDD